MAGQFGNVSRRDRFEKKRSNTKAITWFSIIGGILVIVIIALIIFGGKDQETPAVMDDQEKNETEDFGQDNKVEIEENEDAATEDNSSQPDEPDELELTEESEEKNEEQESQSNENIEKFEVESEDNNVSKAYKGDWLPIGTEQQGSHVTKFDKNSQDWQEMMQAVEVVTGIPTEDQITWWFGNGGNQTVEATVSATETPDKSYRVTLVWVENKLATYISGRTN
ncbi:hypothetical protein JCM21714_3234 [Gracilibacillus boraciitolerans JCM 21714]|uniref:DUF1510 domain-containing protein n=1 Tax=Gracilibacillus boraciitolerans JCM 21714 TaxID=1298598 RepID=W4VL32_9BACI|nr:YrrS family protein [Gracilibacillus boraciitolerans]GAE94100.1 hypothetical protein JCM21714_3234 [Gracilibacillus boraciitolerans JCM 21714]